MAGIQNCDWREIGKLVPYKNTRCKSCCEEEVKAAAGVMFVKASGDETLRNGLKRSIRAIWKFMLSISPRSVFTGYRKPMIETRLTGAMPHAHPVLASAQAGKV